MHTRSFGNIHPRNFSKVGKPEFLLVADIGNYRGLREGRAFIQQMMKILQ